MGQPIVTWCSELVRVDISRTLVDWTNILSERGIRVDPDIRSALLVPEEADAGDHWVQPFDPRGLSSREALELIHEAKLKPTRLAPLLAFAEQRGHELGAEKFLVVAAFVPTPLGLLAPVMYRDFSDNGRICLGLELHGRSEPMKFGEMIFGKERR